MRGFLLRLVCEHNWKRYRLINGDERNYARSEWRCTECNKHRYSQYDDKMDQDVPNERWKKFRENFRYYVGRIGYLLLDKEDKQRLFREHMFQQEVRATEHWLSEFPQMADAARHIRCRVNGVSMELPSDHPDRTASLDISDFREVVRRKYKKL